MMKSLNKEVKLTAKTLEMMVEELSSREELACKGHFVGAEICVVN